MPKPISVDSEIGFGAVEPQRPQPSDKHVALVGDKLMGTASARSSLASGPRKRVTLAALAAQVNLSKPTVSRALNDYPDISAETKKRVRAAADALGYSASSQAKRLVAGRTETVALIIDSRSVGLQSAYQSEFANALSCALSARGYDLLLHSVASPADELRAYQRLLREGKVDGFILMRTRVDDARLDLLLDAGVPFVSQGRSKRMSEHAWHDIDAGQAMEQAVDHLVAEGHQRIGFVAGASNVYSSRFRRAGFERAMARHGLQTSAILPGDFSASGGRRAFQHLRDLSSSPTGVVCANDATAMGVMAEAMSQGLTLPRDLSVVGYDGVRMGELAHPALTTLTHSAAEIGDRIASMFCDLVSGAAIEDNQILAPAQLTRRGSVTGPPE